MSANDPDLPDRIGWQHRAGIHHRLLALAVLVGAASVLAATAAAGDLEPGVVLLLTPLLVWCAIAPDSDLGLLAVLALALQWLIVVDGDARTGPWVLVASVGMLVFHTAMAAGTVAAPGARWTPTMARRWVTRVGAVAASTTMAWLFAVVVDDDRPGSALVLVLALTGTAVTAWSVRVRSLSER